MKKLLISVAIIASLLSVSIWQRHRIIFNLLSSGEPPALLSAQNEYPDENWVDDYYVVVMLDERTFAIGEPRNSQKNYNYLIIGDDRAVLFDAGTGQFDIRPVAQSLTALPITFVPSHFHYDHVGNTVTFERVAVVDLPHVRRRSNNSQLQLEFAEHLGTTEGIPAPILQIGEWLAPNSILDLGGRQLRVLYTPGHTDDSISLLDVESNTLFTGDFIYPGSLFAFMPNSNLGDYLQAAESILVSVSNNTRLYGAHGSQEGGVPELSMGDVQDLSEQLQRIKNGELKSTGTYPVGYLINDNLELLTEPRWLQNWDPRYPPGVIPN